MVLKCNWHCKLLLFIFIFLPSNVNSLVAEDKIISIAIEDNWPPFADRDYKDGGYTTEIAKEVLERMGYRVELHFLPWARAISMTQNGKYAGLPGIYFSEERAKSLAFSDPIFEVEQVFFCNNNSEIVYQGDLQELKPYMIGIVRGYAHGEKFDQATFLNKNEVSSSEDNIRMLLRNRIDLLVDTKKSISYLLQEKFPEDINSLTALEPALLTRKVYMAFSKNRPDYKQLITDFNNTLKIIRLDGTIEKLDQKYGF